MPMITFVDAEGVAHIVEATAGQTLMAVAVDHDVPGIDGECGGDMACGTCHVYVDEQGPAPEPGASEESEMLEVLVDGLKPTSRLGCQVRVTGDLDGLRVTVA